MVFLNRVFKVKVSFSRSHWLSLLLSVSLSLSLRTFLASLLASCLYKADSAVKRVHETISLLPFCVNILLYLCKIFPLSSMLSPVRLDTEEWVCLK